MQPGGSVKDRAARAIVEAARADGRLKPGAQVVEMTSGNMGAGLAVVCAALGHPLVVTMSAGNSPERARMLEALGGGIDGWTACVGTGCTFLGVARTLRRDNPGVICGAVEPAGCQVLAGQAVTKAKHLLQGAGYGIVPPMWEPELMSSSIAVSDEEATKWKLRLAIEEGLYVGFTAAANVCAATKMLSSGVLSPNATVATVLCDTGLKY